MKHIYLFAPFFFYLLLLKQAAPSHQEQQLPTCGFDIQSGLRLQADSTLAERQEQLEKSWQLSQLNPAAGLLPDNYTLPVVVHIIHEAGPENIPDSEVYQGIQNLNDAFANVGYYNPATGTIVPVEFCLAQQDPNGFSTTGITRDISPYTLMNMEDDDLIVKDINRWNPTCYINIWLVREINSLGAGPGVVGYATLPSDHGTPTDGIVLEADWFGSTPEMSSILVHEMGHYLGLYHTFQGACLNNDCLVDGDRVCDTPPDQSTAPIPCSGTMNTCTTDTNSGFATDQNDMTNNYLDYGIPDCLNAFTPGQSDRMVFFIENARSSLLACTSCLDPCPGPISVDLLPAALVAEVGETLNFNSAASGNTNWEWTVDGLPQSTNPSFNFTFNTEGTFLVNISVFNGNPSCFAEDEVLIQVVCPVEPIILPSTLECILPGESIVFDNLSLGADTYEWFLDGVSVSTAETWMNTFPTIGTYQVQLWASNGFCEKYSVLEIIHVGCTEVCDNGYDDDSDGLVDCFDPDCYCEGGCEDYYFNPCYNFCQETEILLPQIEADLDWMTSYNYHVISVEPPVIGDMDQDGIPEVAMRGGNQDNGKWFVFNGDDGSLKFQIDNVWAHAYAPIPVIGDIDRDGYGELIFAARVEDNFNSPGFIHCFEHDGSLKYISANPIQPQKGPSLQWACGQFSLADMDLDGFPELLVGKQVYNAQTGALLVSGASNPFMSYGTPEVGVQGAEVTCASVAVDVLPDSYCVNCSGKEIVAGNQVLAVNLTSGNISIESTADAGYGDGFTDVADLDGDGDLDGIILSRFNGQNVVYAWDLTTSAVLGFYNLPVDNSMSLRHAIADFDGDGQLEIALTTNQKLWMINSDFSLLWSVSIMDVAATDPIPTAFDFEHDGAFEVVIRDEFYVYIIDGATGGIRWQANYDGGTGIDYCPVVDVDGDGLTEILTYARILDGGTQDVLIAFKSSELPWAGCRPVWNQHGYFNVNVEDDLSIHPQQQAVETAGDGTELNGFLMQYPLSEYWAPDAAWDYAYIDCQEDSMKMNFRVCNVGNYTLSHEMPITIYDGNPTNSSPNIITALLLGENLDPYECATFSITIPFLVNQSIHLVLNDDGFAPTPYNLDLDFPVTPVRECDYGNNKTSLQFNYDPPSIDLGPDIATCEFLVTVLDAGPGFSNYIWQDGFHGQIYTATLPGTYWVRGRDDCGYEQSDTIVITVAPSYILDLGNDTTICEGASVSIMEENYEVYEWLPVEGVDCPSCPAVVLTPEETTTYILTATTMEGCYYQDSVKITVQEVFQDPDTIKICTGASALIFGNLEDMPGTYTESYVTSFGCDSILSITLEVVDSIYESTALTICAGESVDIFGVPQNQTGYYEETFDSYIGCDSIVGVFLEVLDTLATIDTVFLCEGDTLDLWGMSIVDGGWYSDVSIGFNGCDSTHYRFVDMLDNSSSFEFIEFCAGDSVNIFGNFESTPGEYANLYVAFNGCDSIHTIELIQLDTFYVEENISICAGDSVLIFGSYESDAGSYQNIFQAENGCDSTSRIILEVRDTSYYYTEFSICTGESIPIFGIPQSTPGLYQQYFLNEAGCDSLVQIALSVLDTFGLVDTISICEGEMIDLWGDLVSDPGWYTAVFQATNGCDSSEYVFLEVLPNASGFEQIEFCQGDSVLVFGSYEYDGGNYSQHFQAVNGCDSVHTIELIELDTIFQEEFLAICSGESIDIFGTAVSLPGIYEMVFASANGCDSTQRIHLEVLDTISTFEAVEICEGMVVDVFGVPVSTPGEFTALFSTASGCDSLHTIEVSVLLNSQTNESLAICAGEEIDIFGTAVSLPGIYEMVFASANGCDSTHTINLEVNPSPTSAESVSICAGEEVLIFGNPETEAGVYEGVFQTNQGCDSIHQVTLTILEAPDVDVIVGNPCPGQSDGTIEVIPVSGLPPFSYSWQHTTANTSVLSGLDPGTYFLTLTDAAGCNLVSAILLTEGQEPEYSLLWEDPNCLDPESGMIWLENVNPGLSFSIDGALFQTSPVFSGLSADTYTIFIQDANGCLFEEQLSLEPSDIGFISLPPVYQIFLGTGVVLSPYGALDEPMSYLWEPATGLSCTDCIEPFASPEITTTYTLTITYTDGCIRTLNTVVEVDPLINVYFPNIFSPDFNGINDLFKPYGKSDLLVNYFRVFDRWGELIYEESATSLQAMHGWDGLFRGQEMETGVYVYLAEVVLPDGLPWVYSGDILLLK